MKLLHSSVARVACLFFGVTPDEIRIFPLAHDESGYIQGETLCTAKRSIMALVSAVGVKDGHGIHGHEEGDVYELEQLVPDRDARAEVLDVAAQVMEHRQFKAVRDALWRTLTFKDHLSRGQIQKIAASVTTTPDADLPPGEPCDEYPNASCPEGSPRRSSFDPQPGDSPAGLAIADADGSNVREFGFAASGPWHPGR